MSAEDDAKTAMGRAIGRIPSGVYILTASHNGQHSAMLASWVQQAALEPPCVSVAVAKDRPIAELIRGSGRFALSVLPEGDKALMKKYGRGIPPGEDPFAGMKTRITPGGSVVLEDALAYVECRVAGGCEFGADHELVIGEITAGEMLREGGPMVHVRGSGFRY